MSIATLLEPTDVARCDASRTTVAASAVQPEDPPSQTRATATRATTGAAAPAGSTLNGTAGAQVVTSGGVAAGGTDDSSSYMPRMSAGAERALNTPSGLLSPLSEWSGERR